MDLTQEPHFPTEIWELIFGHCFAADLRRFRLVCHRWNDIVVGCPSLWNRFHVWFSKSTKNLSPAVLPSVRCATFDGDVEAVSSWWPSFGQKLEILTFNSGTISITVLFEVLKHCTNLKCLYFFKIRMSEGQVDNDFSCDFMEELHIHEFVFDGIDLPSHLGNIFPYLKKLRIFYVTIYTAFVINCWTNFIHAVQGTLESLYLPTEFLLVRQLCQMNRLRLKIVELCIDCNPHLRNMELWRTFCRLQQSLHELSFAGTDVTNEILCVTVQNLPNLKILRSCLYCSGQTVNPTFLQGPNNLQSVMICGVQATLQFRTSLSTTLTELLLGHVTIDGGIEYLINSPNIVQLDLLSCNLSGCRVPPVGNSSGLRHLRLSHGESTPEMLDYILRSHPQLEIAEFFNMQLIDKGSIVKLLCASPKLRKIRLHDCPQLGVASSVSIMLEYYLKAHNLDEGLRKQPHSTRPRLRLKDIELDIECGPNQWNKELWITFYRSQQSLQKLSFLGTDVTNEILCVTVQNLPNLKNLRSCLNCSSLTVPKFLHGPNNLLNVMICGVQATLQFRSLLSPSLTELLLGYVTIAGGIEYLINSPNIVQLNLLSCDLSGCRVPKGNSSGLRHLRISDGKSTPEMLDYILSCHPRLETAEFFDMQFIDKGSMVKLLCASPKLWKIRLHNCCRLGAASGVGIMMDYLKAHNPEGSRMVRFDINDYIENLQIT